MSKWTRTAAMIVTMAGAFALFQAAAPAAQASCGTPAEQGFWHNLQDQQNAISHLNLVAYGCGDTSSNGRPSTAPWRADAWQRRADGSEASWGSADAQRTGSSPIYGIFHRPTFDVRFWASMSRRQSGQLYVAFQVVYRNGGGYSFSNFFERDNSPRLGDPPRQP